MYFWGVFGHFGALFRVPGFTDMRFLFFFAALDVDWIV